MLRKAGSKNGASRESMTPHVARANAAQPVSSTVELLSHGRAVIQTEAKALGDLSAMLDESFAEAVRTILATAMRVVVTGMGKSGHIGRKIAATFAATGTPAIFVHPAEAAHGVQGSGLPSAPGR